MTPESKTLFFSFLSTKDEKQGKCLQRLVVCTHFPASDAVEETKDIRLLALLKLLDVFKGTLCDVLVINQEIRFKVHNRIFKYRVRLNAPFFRLL